MLRRVFLCLTIGWNALSGQCLAPRVELDVQDPRIQVALQEMADYLTEQIQQEQIPGMSAAAGWARSI